MSDAVVTDILKLARKSNTEVTESNASNVKPTPVSEKAGGVVQCAESSAVLDAQPAFALIDIDCLVSYKSNPFALYSGERLELLVESIRENGIITPVIVRRMDETTYEILAGHNRCNAARLICLKQIPCLVCEADDEEALGIVIETNFSQRSISDMLPSELAKSLEMQVELFKTKGKRSDLVQQMQALMSDSEDEEYETDLPENLTYGHGDCKLKNDNILTLSDSTRRRYMRLNLLNEDLLSLVDVGYFTVSCGVQLSYLRAFEQELIASFLEENTAEFDKKKVARLRELSKQNGLTAQKIRMVLTEHEVKPDFVPKVTKPSRTIRDMFPAGTKAKTIESTIVTALKLYFEKTSKESDYEAE